MSFGIDMSDKVVTPTENISPSGLSVIPEPTLIPPLAVISPTESTFVTSSYVKTPVISKSPVTLAPVLVVSKRFVLLY